MQTALREKIRLFHQEVEGIERVGLLTRGDCKDSPIIHFVIANDYLDRKLKEVEEEEGKHNNEGRSRLEKRFAKKEDVNARQRLREECLLQNIVDAALAKGVLFLRPSYVELEKFMPAPSIRVTISLTQADESICRAAAVLKDCALAVLN